MASTYVLSLPTRGITLNVADMPEPPRSLPRRCDEHPQREIHDVIRRDSNGPRCSYCGRRWPEPFDVDSDDVSRPSTYRSPSTSGYASSEGWAIAEHVLPRASSSSSSSHDRLNNLRRLQQDAFAATKPSKPASPFDHTIGLKIRLQPVHSTGRKLQGGIFKASSSSLIGGIDLPLIPWNELRYLSKSDFISEYLKPSLFRDTIETLDESMIQIGTAFQKTSKQEPGLFTSVSFKNKAYDALWDVLGPDTDFQWSVSDGRVVVWIELQFIDNSPQQPPRQRKSRSKAKSIAPGDPSIRASTEASIWVKSEPNQAPFEQISLEAFPQDLTLETHRETSLSSPLQQPSEASEEADLAAATAITLNGDEAPEEAQDNTERDPEAPSVDRPRKRPRAPTKGSVDEEIRPRRSQRETRPTSRARRS